MVELKRDGEGLTEGGYGQIASQTGYPGSTAAERSVSRGELFFNDIGESKRDNSLSGC